MLHRVCWAEKAKDGLPADTPLEWAFPDQADQDAARRRRTRGDLPAARAKLAALLEECPNVLRLQAKLDVLLSRQHTRLAKPRKPLCANARRLREERAVETLLRTVRARADARLPNQERETRRRLMRGACCISPRTYRHPRHDPDWGRWNVSVHAA